VTFDGRGNGRSGRPEGIEVHTRDENVADLMTVLERTGTEEAVLVAHCHANWWALEAASRHPDRVIGLVAIEPGIPYLGEPQPHWREAGAAWDQILESPDGWQLFNRHAIENRHRDWIEFFFEAQLVEPHSSKAFEDAVGWAMESTGRILADSEEAQEMGAPTADEIRAIIAGLDIPVLVIHGDRDVCQHVTKGRELAALTGGQLVEMAGSGHLALARDPVPVNLAIKDFVYQKWRLP
jgi:pimeloyl-ACP methyl ester carboxylesterase